MKMPLNWLFCPKPILQPSTSGLLPHQLCKQAVSYALFSQMSSSEFWLFSPSLAMESGDGVSTSNATTLPTERGPWSAWGSTLGNEVMGSCCYWGSEPKGFWQWNNQFERKFWKAQNFGESMIQTRWRFQNDDIWEDANSVV